MRIEIKEFTDYDIERISQLIANDMFDFVLDIITDCEEDKNGNYILSTGNLDSFSDDFKKMKWGIGELYDRLRQLDQPAKIPSTKNE